MKNYNVGGIVVVLFNAIVNVLMYNAAEALLKTTFKENKSRIELE